MSFTSPQADCVPDTVQHKLWHLIAWLEPQREALGLLEIVPGMGNLLLRGAQLSALHSLAEAIIRQWPDLAEQGVAGRCIDIPVSYGAEHGPDLEAIAIHCGLSPEQVIARHCSATYTVLCLGFQPGFAYLGGLDKALHMPRRASPRLSVPAGSVAIGGSHSAIYPSQSPGGWHIIGQTQRQLFAADAAQPVLLRPGDSVRFLRHPEST